jgi:hypothetical protein
VEIDKDLRELFLRQNRVDNPPRNGARLVKAAGLHLNDQHVVR